MYQHSNHRGARGEEKEQEIESLFEKMIKENFPNLVKKVDIKFRKYRVPNKMDAKRDHTTTHRN